MLANSIRMDLEPIKNRLIEPRDIRFSGYTLVHEPYTILWVKPEDIFFVSPTLFLWIDSGIQQFNGSTTSPKYLKLVDTLVCELPKAEFKDIDKKYSELLMIINLNFNPNLKSVEGMQTEINYLKSFVTKAKEFFTGEHWSE